MPYLSVNDGTYAARSRFVAIHARDAPGWTRTRGCCDAPRRVSALNWAYRGGMNSANSEKGGGQPVVVVDPFAGGAILSTDSAAQLVTTNANLGNPDKVAP